MPYQPCPKCGAKYTYLLQHICEPATETRGRSSGRASTGGDSADERIERVVSNPTREKRLEDVLRELCEALDGTTTDGGIRVHVAIERACELIPRKP